MEATRPRKRQNLKLITRRPSIVIAGLSLLAILFFLFVNRLVNRFREQEKALARRLYAQAEIEQKSGRAGQAIEDFRVALSYDRDNFQYQLTLARALRDNGQQSEARDYLMSLWERTPESALVNLALARLAAREKSTDEALHYYHNAIYGKWESNAESNRRNVQFEMVEFLLRQNVLPQAQAELIILSTTLPAESNLHLRVAQLFRSAQDYERALEQYKLVLEHDRENEAALAGAGEASFQLKRYSSAAEYLGHAVKLNPGDKEVVSLYQISRQILQLNPFARRISGAERRRRVRLVFDRSGGRLNRCASVLGVALNGGSPGSGDNRDSPSPAASDAASTLVSLKQRWLATKAKVFGSPRSEAADGLDAAVDLAFQIEAQCEKLCAPGSDTDRALVLLSQSPNGAEP
jgi:tetratricopeptide (TPR) repeat protein